MRHQPGLDADWEAKQKADSLPTDVKYGLMAHFLIFFQFFIKMRQQPVLDVYREAK